MKKLIIKIIISILLLIGMSACSKNIYVNPLILHNENNSGNILLAKELKLEYIKNLFFVDLKVNGINARFLIDTGASTSLIDIDESKKYEVIMKSVTNKKIVGVGGVINKYSVKNISVTNNFDHEILLKLHAADLSHVISAMSSDGLNVVGVIGSDYLKYADAIINYSNNTLILYSNIEM